MANTRELLVDRFIAISGTGKKQAATGTGMSNANIDTRLKCTISREEVITRRDVRDCRNEDLVDSQVVTRLARYTLNFAEVTPQIMAIFAAYDLGQAAVSAAAPAQNEHQTVTVSADGTLSLTMEGRTVTTKTIPSAGLTAAVIKAALTTSQMLFIHPGDIDVTGTGPFLVIFQGRLANADIPLMSGTGGFVVTAAQAGAQNYHQFSRSTSRSKVRFSFVMGYEDQTASIEKYIDYAVESINPQASLGTDPSYQVTMIGPWDYDSLEPGFTIPDCINPTPLLTEECRVKVDGNWESPDVNSINSTYNDNVPVDRLSAFPYDGQDVQTLIRGKNPSYNSLLSIFNANVTPGAVNNHVYKLAHEERSTDPVSVIMHYGFPGNRFTLLQPESKIRFQNNRETFIGTAETHAVNVEAVPFKNVTDPPISAEAYLAQATAFLTT
jgi:hypothetical protein